MLNEAHPCLGIALLGQCNAASAVYFDLGGAVAALGFILTVQQLLRPIYRFRLRARYLTLPRIYGLVFAGVGLVVVSATLPSLPQAPNNPFDYPILWELAATLLFAIAYGAVVLAVIKPVGVRPRSTERFAIASAWLLSSADERDQIDYLQDLTCSLPTLIRVAGYGEGLRDTTAFFDFIHRRNLARASYAWSFLRIVADPVFCATVVRRASWLGASILRELDEKRLYSEAAAQFVRELAKQAILRDDSMMEREVGYHGFGTAPLLSDSLFSRHFILRMYDPLDSFRFMAGSDVTATTLKRFNSAAEKALASVIESGDIWHSQVAYSIKEYYRSVFMGAQSIRARKDTQLIMEMGRSIELAVKMAGKLEDKVAPDGIDMLYARDADKYRHDVLETLTEIVYEALASISNYFEGFDDAYWLTCIDTFQEVYPSFGDEPDGMTPFQQRLAMKLIKKLADNMDGFYPSICRVLLACIGPYYSKAESPNRTAHRILKDAVYCELQKLPGLAAKKPENVADYLPPNVEYEAAEMTLVHTYSGGSKAFTKLGDLGLGAVSLATADVRRADAPTE